MLKNSLVSVLPEFNGTEVDEQMLEVYLTDVDTSLPTVNYADEDKAKAYWVAMNYFDAEQRASALDGSSLVKSEKIEDVATTYKDGTVSNPYTKLFYGNIVKDERDECNIPIGFMC